MPKIPTYVADQGLDTQRSTQPRIQVDTSAAQALSQLAGTAQDTVNFFVERNRKQREQLEEYKTERSFQEFQNNVLLDSVEYENTAEPGAPDFYKNWNDRYETIRKEWETTVPQSLLPKYQIKTEGFKGQVGVNIARKEVDLRNDYYKTTLDKDVEGLSTTVFNDPSMYNDVLDTIEERVSMSGLPAQEKAERLETYKEKLDESTVAGFVQAGRFDEAREFIAPLNPPGNTVIDPQGAEPNVMNEENWNLQNYSRWEFGDPEFQIDTPVARAMDMLATASGRKYAFTAKKDSVKVRVDDLPEFERRNLVLNAKASGFSSFAFSKTDKGEFVTMRTDDEGVSNRPEWLSQDMVRRMKSYSKAAGVNSKYLPVGNSSARKLLKLIDDEEDRQNKEKEELVKQVQSDTAKDGWRLLRDNQLTSEWLDMNVDALSETDFSQLTKAHMREVKGNKTGKDAIYKNDRGTYVELMRRAVNPNDETVIQDAVEAYANTELDKGDFDKIFNTYTKTTTDGELGKPAAWKKELRQYVVDKIKPADDDDTVYLDKRLEALAEFDDMLKANPDMTRDDARKKAQEILKRHITDSNQSKRETLPMGTFLKVGRYMEPGVLRDGLVDAAKRLKAARDQGTITEQAYQQEAFILGEWSKMLTEEEKGNSQ